MGNMSEQPPHLPLTYTNRVSKRVNHILHVPGGEIVNASSEDECLFDGMSYRSRVGFLKLGAAVHAILRLGSDHPLAGRVPRTIERRPLNRHQEAEAPAQTWLISFGQGFGKAQRQSFKMGAVTRFKRLFPNSLQAAYGRFTKWQKIPAVVSGNAVLLALKQTSAR